MIRDFFTYYLMMRCGGLGDLCFDSHKDDLADAACNKTELEPCEKKKQLKGSCEKSECGECEHGLLGFRKWWERESVCVCINGNKVCGTPIFVENGTLRVVNDEHSYFVPLDKVDYIQTNDGLLTDESK